MGNFPVYVVNLGFLIIVLSLYAILSRRHGQEQLRAGFVGSFLALYGGYIVLMTWLLWS